MSSPSVDASQEPPHTQESDGLVILSAAKDLLATLDPRKKIVRCAQDDIRFILGDKAYIH